MTAHSFVIGEPAAIYMHDYSEGRVHRVTVERDTKLYWIADGRKFRKSDGLEPGSTSNWGRGKYLLPLKDPKVIQALTAARKSAAFSEFADAYRELAKARESFDAIKAVRVALDAYAATIE